MGVDIKASRFFDILAVAAMLLLFLGYSSNQKSAIAGGMATNNSANYRFSIVLCNKI